MSVTPLRAPIFRRRFARLALILLALWLLLCAVVAFWLPGKLQRTAAEWGVKHGHQLIIGDVSINPFRWTVTLRDIRLADGMDQPLFLAQGIRVNLDPSDLLIGRYRLSELVLDRPQLTLARQQGGRWNWERFIQAVQAPGPVPPSPATEPPDLLIDHLAIQQGSMVARDSMAPAWRLDPLNLILNDLATRPREGAYQLTATLDDGARLEWRGSLSLAPLVSAGDIRVSKLTLARLWPLTGDAIRLAAPRGSLDVQARYQLTSRDKLGLTLSAFSASLDGLALEAPGKASRFELPQIKLSGGSFDLAEHRLHIAGIELLGGKLSVRKGEDGELDWLAALPAKPADAAPPQSEQPMVPAPWRVAVEKIAFRDWSLSLHDASTVQAHDLAVRIPAASFAIRQNKQGLGLEALQAELADLNIGDGKGGVPLTIATASMAPGTVELDGRKAMPGKLTVTGLSVIASRGADGKIDLSNMFKPLQPKASEPSRWKVVPPELALTGSGMSWHDLVENKPVAITLADLQGTADLNGDADLKLRLGGALGGAAQGARRGAVEADLLIQTEAGRAEGSIRLKQVPLQPLAPYAVAGTPLTLASGDVSARLQLRMPAAGGWQLGGSANVGSLTVMEPKQADPLVAWEGLNVEGLTVKGGKALAVNIDKLRLESPRLRLRLDEQRNLNLTTLFTPPDKQKPTPATTPASAVEKTARVEAVVTDAEGNPTADAPKSAPAKRRAKDGPQLSIRSVVVKSAALDFADRSLNPGFASQIHDLSGTVQGVATDPNKHTTVTLDGQVDRYGVVRIRGTLAPFAVSDDSALVMSFKNIPINSLDPYSSNFAGWHLQDGRLNVDLRYALKDRVVKGENKVVIQSIKLGEEVDKPGVTKLPLSLAVALLEDSDGRIELELPVSGRLDDPEFSYGHLIGQAIANVLTKIVTSPFRALASLLGSEGFEAVTFAPGQAAVAPPESEKLAKLAEMLGKRPRLTVAMAGTYDPKTDVHAMARVQIDTEILTKAGLKPEAGLPVGRPDFEDPATQAAIRSSYGSRIGQLALAGKLISTKDEPARYKAFREEMIAAVEKSIDTPTLLTLARQRAELAKAQIVAAAPALADRITLGEPAVAESHGEGVPMEIKLDTRGAAEPTMPAGPAVVAAPQ
ncbi:DUF748 domain-containing protein [Chitinimonas naiadis]